MLQGVRECLDELSIVRRHLGEICRLIRTGQENGLRGACSAVRLNPLTGAAIHDTSPQSDRSLSEVGIRELHNDAADVSAGKEIGAGELQIIQGALRVEEKG